MSFDAAQFGAIYTKNSNYNICNIFEFLDEREVASTALVCKAWRDHLPMNEARTEVKKAVLIERSYPRAWVQIFRDCQKPIKGLPELDLMGRNDDHFECIAPQNLTNDVMRFTDHHERPGIAIQIKLRNPLQLPTAINSPLPPYFSLEETEIKSVNEMLRTAQSADQLVLILYKRYSQGDNWKFEVRDSNFWESKDFFNVLKYFHPQHETCPNCPFPSEDTINNSVISHLLSGKDPVFMLTGAKNNSAEPIKPSEPQPADPRLDAVLKLFRKS